MEKKFYDGNQLLNKRDLNGNKPEIFLCVGNRTGGKTTFFTRFFINRNLKHGEKTIILYRNGYEIENCVDKFFGGMSDFFPELVYDMELIEKTVGCLYINGEPFGYSVPLNKANKVKNLSKMLSDASWMFFDEFQSEDGNYLKNEIQKFSSIHVSAARGYKKMITYLPVILCSNAITMLNPYYIELGIPQRLKKDTHFLRGNGWVLEHFYSPDASEALKGSAFAQAIGGGYMEYAAENVYLNDDFSLVGQLSMRSVPLADVIMNREKPVILSFATTDTGLVVVRKRKEPASGKVFRSGVDGTEMDIKASILYNALKRSFQNGLLRFHSFEAKGLFFNML